MGATSTIGMTPTFTLSVAAAPEPGAAGDPPEPPQADRPTTSAAVASNGMSRVLTMKPHQTSAISKAEAASDRPDGVADRRAANPSGRGAGRLAAPGSCSRATGFVTGPAPPSAVDSGAAAERTMFATVR